MDHLRTTARQNTTFFTEATVMANSNIAQSKLNKAQSFPEKKQVHMSLIVTLTIYYKITDFPAQQAH